MKICGIDAREYFSWTAFLNTTPTNLNANLFLLSRKQLLQIAPEAARMRIKSLPQYATCFVTSRPIRTGEQLCFYYGDKHISSDVCAINLAQALQRDAPELYEECLKKSYHLECHEVDVRATSPDTINATGYTASCVTCFDGHNLKFEPMLHTASQKRSIENGTPPKFAVMIADTGHAQGGRGVFALTPIPEMVALGFYTGKLVETPPDDREFYLEFDEPCHIRQSRFPQ